MKLTRERVEPAMYSGRLEPFRFVFRETFGSKRWHVVVWETREEGYRITRRWISTLDRAKQYAVRWWLLGRMNALYRLACTGGKGDLAEFDTLLRAYAERGDTLAPAAMRDWLEEHGMADKLNAWVAQRGRKARVKWPKGWEFLSGPKR